MLLLLFVSRTRHQIKEKHQPPWWWLWWWAWVHFCWKSSMFYVFFSVDVYFYFSETAHQNYINLLNVFYCVCVCAIFLVWKSCLQDSREWTKIALAVNDASLFFVVCLLKFNEITHTVSNILHKDGIFFLSFIFVCRFLFICCCCDEGARS